MLIIADKKLPPDARATLAESGTVLELETEGIVYPAISGHPDIFFCSLPGILVVSPSLPEKYFHVLDQNGIIYRKGTLPSGNPHPASVHYCAAADDRYLVHRLEYTDPVILENAHALKKIPVTQGYTRCNLVLLKDHHYMTSDRGIHRSLMRNGLEGLFVSPEGILLPGFKNGFLGGTTGVLGDQVFLTGSLSGFPGGDTVREYLEALHYNIKELSGGPLVDAGGIFFL